MTCPKCKGENTAKAIFTAYYCLTCGWVWEDDEPTCCHGIATDHECCGECAAEEVDAAIDEIKHHGPRR